MTTIPIERLRELFIYDPATGLLTNRVDRGSRAREGREAAQPKTGRSGASTADGELSLLDFFSRTRVSHNHTKPMTVKELIEELQKHDPEKMVVQQGYEGGHGEVTRVEEIRLKLNVNTAWYYGPHEEDEGGECEAINIG